MLRSVAEAMEAGRGGASATPAPQLAAPATPMPADLSAMEEVSPEALGYRPREWSRGGPPARGYAAGGGRAGASSHGGVNGTGRRTRDWTVTSSGAQSPKSKKSRWDHAMGVAREFAESVSTPSSGDSTRDSTCSMVSSHWLCQIPPSQHLNPKVG